MLCIKFKYLASWNAVEISRKGILQTVMRRWKEMDHVSYVGAHAKLT